MRAGKAKCSIQLKPQGVLMLEMYILAINEDSAKSTKALADATRVGSTQQPRCVKQENREGFRRFG